MDLFKRNSKTKHTGAGNRFLMAHGNTQMVIGSTYR